MSSNGASSGSGLVGLQSIPAGSRKVVQSLKEVVNCPEAEIYSILKECNMDPNEAVNRLLSQDPFRKVKSKREKKKENKDLTDSRSRGASSSSNRASRNGTERYGGRGGSTQFGYSEPGALPAKLTHRKENGLHSASGTMGKNPTHQSLAYSDSTSRETKVSTKDVGYGILLALQTPGYQPALLGVPGQMSMADIVKMGRPLGKTSSIPNSFHTVNHNPLQRLLSETSYQNLHSSEDHALNSETHPEPEVTSLQPLSFKEQWHLVEQLPTTKDPSVLVPASDSEGDAGLSTMPFAEVNWHSESQTNEVWATDDSSNGDIGANHIGSASVSIRMIQEDASGGAFFFDKNSCFDIGSPVPQNHTLRHQNDEDVSLSVSSVATNLQQLSIQNDDPEVSTEENGPSVVIPNHLQLQTADCSHLSFGCFGSGISANFSVPFVSRQSKADLKEGTADVDASAVGHSDVRNSDYYGEESLRSTSNGDLAHRTIDNDVSYDSLAASQPEALNQENSGMIRGNQYASTSSSTFENDRQLNIPLSQSQTTSQMQNLAPFSSAMQAHTNSLPSALLAANVRPVEESDHHYSPFLLTQSMPIKYSNMMSSIGGSTISMPEASETIDFSSGQHIPETLPGTSVASGALQQHLGVNPYSQPSLPLGHFTNMIGYPFLPQSYPYVPAAYQQAFTGNSTYHQSLAAVLPQYKNNVSVSSLPMSAGVASGYGAFGSSTSIPGSFATHPDPSAAGTTIRYDDLTGSQYKDSNQNQLLSLQQNENLAMWLHETGNRTMSAVPARTYYSLEGQSQQPGGFRQGQQQPSQNYGGLGFPNFYHSQTGLSLDHQQQHHHPRDGSLSGSQGQPKQSQHIWPNSY